MLKFKSLKFRIIAIGTILVVIGAIARHYLILPTVQEQVRDLVSAQQMSAASYAASEIDHAITSRLALLNLLAADLPPQLVKQPRKLAAWLRERQRVNPAFSRGLLAVRPDGRGLLAEFPVLPGRARLDFSTRDWFVAAAQANGAVMGQPMPGLLADNKLIIFAAPVRDHAGNLLTVLAGTVQLDAPGFLQTVQQTRLGVSGGFLVVSPAYKLFVASSDPELVLQPTPEPGVNPLLDRAMSGWRGTGITVNADGVEELSAFVSVPSTGWFVVAHMPTEEAFRPVQALRGAFSNGSVALLLFMLLILMFVLPRVLRPLTDAALAMREMADGRRGMGPLPVVRDDEVGALVRGFNVLAERLAKEEEARKASESRLQYLAHHDSLTGLYNRVMLEDRITQALARSERTGLQVALLFCDMNGFKPINDRYGHEAGDAVLRHVAECIRAGRRQTDTVARIGGDEFVILLADVEDARHAAISVARQCLAALDVPFDIQGDTLKLSMSIGIAVHNGAAASASNLMSRADAAMYRAKKSDSGGVYWIDDEQERVLPEPAG